MDHGSCHGELLGGQGTGIVAVGKLKPIQLFE